MLPVLREVAHPRRADIQHVRPLGQRLGVVLRQRLHRGIVLTNRRSMPKNGSQQQQSSVAEHKYSRGLRMHMTKENSKRSTGCLPPSRSNHAGSTGTLHTQRKTSEPGDENYHNNRELLYTPLFQVGKRENRLNNYRASLYIVCAVTYFPHRQETRRRLLQQHRWDDSPHSGTAETNERH